MIVKSLYGLHHMPGLLNPLDLSKVVVECGSISHPSLKESYARGLKVYKLEIDHSESLEEDFGNSKFPGLHVINLAMHRHPIFLEWFPRLASTHPLLQKVILVSMSNSEIHYTADTITSLLPFIAKSSQQGLDIIYSPGDQSRSIWLTVHFRVAGHTKLIMNVQSSLLVILPFAASCFPYIHTLVWGFIMRDDTMSMNSLFSPHFGHSECCNPLTKRYTGHESHFTTLIRPILHMALKRKPGYIGICLSFPRVCLL
ncbi:hypothetical protein F5879DRAFT_376388 [Lentinula edodes]|nr:hypothetical protein F5879DRAFT_376388 [Lentinula edodes]